MTANKIIIIGTGYVGKELARQAIDAGLEVVGTTRNDETIQTLHDLGATVYRWSVDDEQAPWVSHLGPDTAVVYSIPTLFRSYQEVTETDGVGSMPRHIIPIDRVLTLCEERGCDRFIYLSSTSVYGDHGGEWVDETSPLRPASPVGKMRADIESHLMNRNSIGAVTIARLVGIYGPGRTLLDYLQSGRYSLVNGGKKVTNRIHVHDIVRAILAIIDQAPRDPRIYNLTDGHPQTVRDLIEFITSETGIDRPPEESLEEYARRKGPNSLARWKNSIRVRNDRLRQEFDFQPEYPDVFSGYKALLKKH